MNIADYAFAKTTHTGIGPAKLRQNLDGLAAWAKGLSLNAGPLFLEIELIRR